MEIWDKSATVDPEVRAYVYSLVTAVGGRSSYDDAYSIGDDALATLKDIRRWLLLYDERNNRLDVKRILAEANLVQGDLLEILSLWADNAPESGLRGKLAFVCLELLVPLTLPLELEEETASVNTHRHLPYLKLAQVRYKRAILHHEGSKILSKIVRVALPCMAKEKSDRTRRDEGTIMLMMFLLRNVAMITQPQHLPSQGDENEISRAAVVECFYKQGIFDVLLTMGSVVNDEFSEHDTELLDLLYQMLKGIDPAKLFMDKAQVEKAETIEFKNLLKKEKVLLSGYNKIAPTRHNRFGTMLWVKQEDEKLATVTGQSSITNQKALSEQMDTSKKWNKPKHRGRTAQDADTESGFGQRIEIEGSAKKHLRSFVEDFLDSSFNPLFTSLRKGIERELDRVKEETKKQYFYTIRWFLGAEAARQAARQTSASANTGEETPFAYVAAVLDQETFVLLNRSMQQAIDEKDWHKLQAALQALTQILLTVQRMSESKNEDDQEIADNILSRIFYEESTHDRIASVLRSYNHQGFAYLDAITECVHVFVRMLEHYSKQNGDLQIRSKRRARRKAKANKAAPIDPEAAQDEADEAEEDAQEAYRAASERKFDFQRFVSKFMNQGCVDTFIAFVQYYNEMNSAQLKRCHRYFYRLAFKADLALLLFRVDILNLFQRMIKGPGSLATQTDILNDWEMLVRQVFRKCIKWISKDVDGQGWKEMCVVEMLFSKISNTHFYLQNSYERVIEKRPPRAPAELEFKASIESQQKIPVAVSIVVDRTKSDDLKWIKDQMQRCVDERRAWEDAEIAQTQLEQTDGDVQQTVEGTQASAPTILLTYDGEERKLSLFKDKYLRLLMQTLGFERLGLEEDVDALWYAPSQLSSEQLAETLEAVKKAEFDPPVFDDGKSAQDMVKNKSANRARASTSEIESGPEDDVQLDADGQLFPPNLREKRKNADRDPSVKKRRRVSRRADEDESLSDFERRAEARRKREREKNAKIKSNLFVTNSDDESDLEGDAEFFRLEEERRQKMRGVISNALKTQEQRDQRGKQKRNAQTSTSMDASQSAESDASNSPPSRTAQKQTTAKSQPRARQPIFQDLSDDSSDDGGTENLVNGSSQRNYASSTTSIEHTATSPLKELSVNATQGSQALEQDVAMDDDDDEILPVRKRGGRRRAVVDDDESD